MRPSFGRGPLRLRLIVSQNLYAKQEKTEYNLRQTYQQGTTIATPEERIQKLEEKLSQEKAKKAKIEARKRHAEAKKTRQDDTRKKVLIGAFVLEKAADESILNFTINGAPFSEWLTRPADRALFGLKEG